MAMRLAWTACIAAACLGGCGGGGSGSTTPIAASSGNAPSQMAFHEGNGAGGSGPTAGATKAAAAPTVEVLRPLTPSPFPRATTYTLYGANGSQKLLRLDFSGRRYEILDAVGQSTSGTFAEDAEDPGTYVFASARLPASPGVSRFRVTPGAVVGAFPFERPGPGATTYGVTPFVAANDFVASPAELDGDYTRLGLRLNRDGAIDSQVVPMRISSSGTVLEACLDATLVRVDSCPVASKRRYAVSASADGVWTARSSAPAESLAFRMARINGEKVWLSSDGPDASPDAGGFHVGLRNTGDWAAMHYAGAASDGSWGRTTVGFMGATRSSTGAPGASSTTQALAIAPPPATAPRGVWQLDGDGAFFLMRNAALAVTLGRPGTTSQGQMQLGLFREHATIYRLAATNGTRPELRLDMGARSYTLTESTGESVTGSFYAATDSTGIFIFSSPRITAVANTARFKIVDNIIVGGFPFAVTQSATPAFAVQPFVGSSKLETEASALDGVYNRLGIDVSPTASTSSIQQFGISNGGKELARCMSARPLRIDQCPPQDQQHWTIDPFDASSPGSVRMVETANPSNYTYFSVAPSAGQKIFLIAGKSLDDPANAVFRIGVSESANWPSGGGDGLATTGSWGRVQVYPDHSTRAVLLPDGTTRNTYNPLSAMDADGPLGMRALYGTPETYFTMQGAKIFALVGANNASTGGYLQLSLMD